MFEWEKEGCPNLWQTYKHNSKIMWLNNGLWLLLLPNSIIVCLSGAIVYPTSENEGKPPKFICAHYVDSAMQVTLNSKHKPNTLFDNRKTHSGTIFMDGVNLNWVTLLNIWIKLINCFYFLLSGKPDVINLNSFDLLSYSNTIFLLHQDFVLSLKNK